MLLIVQVFEARQNLRDNELGFFFLYLLRFLEIIVEIWPTAQFEYSAEAVMVDLNGVEMLYYTSVIQLFVDFIFSESMFYVIIFHLISPTIIKVMDFACNFTAIFKVKGLVNFREATFSENREY